MSQFIATQGPLPHTFEDFWEMVIQYHCPAIVMITRLVDNYKVFPTCFLAFHYWFYFLSILYSYFLLLFYRSWSVEIIFKLRIDLENLATYLFPVNGRKLLRLHWFCAIWRWTVERWGGFSAYNYCAGFFTDRYEWYFSDRVGWFRERPLLLETLSFHLILGLCYTLFGIIRLLEYKKVF